MRVDANQWPTAKIVASVNNYLDTVAGYAIGADKRFQWDDTNHTKLPIGTTDLTATQANYSFLTDEQGNNIVTLTRIDIKDPNGVWRQLILVDQSDIVGFGLDSTLATPTLPMYYDKIADNIIRLYPAPAITVAGGLKFYFQRTGSYFVATDTTKAPGVSPLLHRGFVIAAALDGAITLGLPLLSAIEGEMTKEMNKMTKYFASDRNNDSKDNLTVMAIRFR
jgi:hypothetical protein